MELSRIEKGGADVAGRQSSGRDNMEQARRLLREAVGDQDAQKPRGADSRNATVDFDKLLHLRPTLQQPSPEPSRPASRPSQQDWPAALDLVRQAAEVVRQSEYRVQEQEARIQDLVQRVRGELKAAQDRAEAAEARVQAVEQRAQATEARAEGRVKAAETRAREAEARAEAAHQWLTRIHDTIVSQLSDFLSAQRSA
jgi:ABC-type Na+ efflux pump permease subunit